METLSISLGFSIGGLKRITAAGWRIAECGWWLVAAAVIKGGAAHNRHKSPRLAALASPFFVLVAPASSSLERPHGAQKNPKLVLGAFVGLEVRSGFEPL
jgi:hypothetical protein